MVRRLPTIGDGALWFWAKITRQDLVDCCRRSEGGVLLTCKVPRERVLLSHFVDWHSVLNGRPLVSDLPPASAEDFDARLKRRFLAPGNYGLFETWQATTHDLRADDVVEAVRLE